MPSQILVLCRGTERFPLHPFPFRGKPGASMMRDVLLACFHVYMTSGLHDGITSVVELESRGRIPHGVKDARWRQRGPSLASALAKPHLCSQGDPPRRRP